MAEIILKPATDTGMKQYDICKPYIDMLPVTDGTKMAYLHQLKVYLNCGHDVMDAVALKSYLQTIGNSAGRFLCAAIKHYAKGLQLELKMKSTPENVDYTTAALYRLDAVMLTTKAIPGEGGSYAKNWLSYTQVKNMFLNIDTSTKIGRRNRIVLLLGVTCGMRRSEMIAAKFGDVVTTAEGPVINILGKGKKRRSVPIRGTQVAAIAEWKNETDGTDEDRIVRGFYRGGKLRGTKISTLGIYRIVRALGVGIGLLNLKPHDLRRAYSQLGLKGGIQLGQMAKLLGHSDVRTTMIYVNPDLDFDITASDFIPFV